MIEAARQLALDLPHRPALGREDFLVAAANEMAVAWIDRWPDWPQPALLLCGAPGSGKTHMISVWRRASGAVEVDGDALARHSPPELLGDAVAGVVDGADEMLAGAGSLRPALERGLLHLYNVLRERGGHLLVSGRGPLRQWPVALPDLRSRLAAAPAVALGPPDDRLLAAVMVKLFADRQLRVAPEVIRFLLPRMERSFAAARQVVAALDGLSLASRREITVPLARHVLEVGAGDPDTRGEDTYGPGDRG